MTTKLLAVDDSKTMQKVLEITFAGEIYDAQIVGSAADALNAVRAGAPQVAVVDAHLGSTSGYDLCRQIKEAAPGVKVLLLSSKQRPYDDGAGAAAGVDDHFDKPFDSTKFLAKLAELAAGASAPVAAAARPVAAPPVAPAPVVAVAPVAVAPPVAAAPVAASPAPAPLAPKASAPAQRPQAPPALVPNAPVLAQASPAEPPRAAAAVATNGMKGQLEALGLTAAQVEGVLSLSRTVVEQVVWEVVPALAETMIREEIARLTSE